MKTTKRKHAEAELEFSKVILSPQLEVAMDGGLAVEGREESRAL